MKKRLMAVLAATAVLGCTTAFAVNPFSDVTPNDWAYQAVAQLAAEGVINGYPDGTFKGQRNITRYEMAQMIAKAMAHQSRVDAEQQAMIQRLANEFSAELNNLGVRVGNLEKKVGNVRWSGNANVKYTHSDKVEADKSATTKEVAEDSKWTVGAELDLHAAPNKNVEFGAVVKTKDLKLGDASHDAQLYFDKLWVGTNVKGFALKAGRLPAFLGSGLVLDSKMDGVSAGFDAANLGFEVGHGDVKVDAAADALETTYAQVTGKVANKLNVTGYYLQLHKNDAIVLSTEDKFQYGPKDKQYDVTGQTAFDKVYGVSLETNVQGLKLMGEWATSNAKHVLTPTVPTNAGLTEDAKDRDAWVVGAGFGNYDIAKAGTADLMVQYFNEGVNSPILATTYDQDQAKDFKGWVLTGNYALADNLGLTLVYGFSGEKSAEVTKGDTHKDYPSHYYAKLKYKF